MRGRLRLGGLGGVVVENLARLGVESFVLVDHGTFEPTNSNRQIYSFTDTNGRLKTEVTEEFLRRINPAIRTRKYLTMTDQNIGEVLEGVDAVALSIDDIRAIVTLSRAARAKKIPLIEGWAVAQERPRFHGRHAHSGGSLRFADHRPGRGEHFRPGEP
ncbi:MAG: ThiF family adenylyltransferase [Elusimicrobia bacterium]|nr:ThiF family adenylyltransferase [Elusimicrobiota bacterium]